MASLYVELVQGGDWREALDGLRPWTVKLWKSMSVEDRKIFVAKGGSLYGPHSSARSCG